MVRRRPSGARDLSRPDLGGRKGGRVEVGSGRVEPGLAGPGGSGRVARVRESSLIGDGSGRAETRDAPGQGAEVVVVEEEEEEVPLVLARRSHHHHHPIDRYESGGRPSRRPAGQRRVPKSSSRAAWQRRRAARRRPATTGSAPSPPAIIALGVLPQRSPEHVGRHRPQPRAVAGHGACAAASDIEPSKSAARPRRATAQRAGWWRRSVADLVVSRGGKREGHGRWPAICGPCTRRPLSITSTSTARSPDRLLSLRPEPR